MPADIGTRPESTYGVGETARLKSEWPAHFRLSPSSSKRWLACPGSAVEGLPDDAGPAAEAGTIGHKAAQEWIDNSTPFNPLFLLESQVYDATRPIVGSAAAGEIALATTYYASTIAALREKYGVQPHTEIKLRHATIHDFGGTLDTSFVGTRTLAIADFKSGVWGVDAKANPQLMSYSALARQEWPGREKYIVHIIQPRRNDGKKSFQTATFSNPELDAFEQLVAIAAKSDARNAGDHCRFCPLRPDCKPGKKFARSAGW